MLKDGLALGFSCTRRARLALKVVHLQVEWNKGHALSHLLQSLSLSDSSDVLPIYIGDDRTDEDAFAVLSENSKGVGILVSTKVDHSPSCKAQYPSLTSRGACFVYRYIVLAIIASREVACAGPGQCLSVNVACCHEDVCLQLI